MTHPHLSLLLTMVMVVWSSLPAADAGPIGGQAGGTDALFVTDVPLLALGAGKAADGEAADVVIGGQDDAVAVIRLDRAFIERLVVEPADLRTVVLRLKALTLTGETTSAVVQVHGLRPAGGQALGDPLATIPLPDPIPGNRLVLDGLGPAVAEALGRDGAPIDLRLSLASPVMPKPRLVLAGIGVKSQRQRPHVLIGIIRRPKVDLFAWEVKPTAGTWVVDRQGELDYGGKPLRLWGAVAIGNGESYVRRMSKMGFNAARVWGPEADIYDEASGRKGELRPTTPGDGSPLDRFDRNFAHYREHGMFVMATMLIGQGQTGPEAASGWIMPGVFADDSFIAGGDDWGAWKQAMQTKDAPRHLFHFFDERLQTLRKRWASNILTHMNPYTGRRYADEESISTFEVANENAFVSTVLNQGFAKWPAYFRNKLQRRWNAWLITRYQDEAGVKAAWGRLEKGESSAKGSIQLAPLAGQRERYPSARASDFVRFIIDTADAFNQDYRAHCRALAAPGQGVAVIPFSFDTQYRPSTQWTYGIARGDVQNFGMYFWDMTSTAGHRSMYIMDSCTVEGKLTAIYETNSSRPGPWRAEVPLRMAAFASQQGWDAVYFHLWENTPADTLGDEAILTLPLPYGNADHYWTATHDARDPVKGSALAIAGQLFRSRAIPTCTQPSRYRVGSRGIFSYERTYIGQSAAAFSRGSRLVFEPEADHLVEVENPPPSEPSQEQLADSHAARNGILWDQEFNRLIIDTPQAKAYVGKVVPSYTFKDGIVLSGFTTSHIVFAMSSADGKPLVGADAAKRVHLIAVQDAKNTGYEMDWTARGGPDEHIKATRNRGRAPVIVDRVGCTMSFPTTLDFHLTGYDYARRQVLSRTESASVVRLAPQNFYMSVLEISQRGAPAPAVVDPSPGVVSSGEQPVADLQPAGTARAWHPLPGVAWSQTPTTALETLARAHPGRTERQGRDAQELVIAVREVTDVMSRAALAELTFNKGRMHQVRITFAQPPPLNEVIAHFTREFGKPAEQHLVTVASDISRIRWQIDRGGPLAITVTETQGMVRVLYEPR